MYIYVMYSIKKELRAQVGATTDVLITFEASVWTSKVFHSFQWRQMSPDYTFEISECKQILTSSQD